MPGWPNFPTLLLIVHLVYMYVSLAFANDAYLMTVLLVAMHSSQMASVELATDKAIPQRADGHLQQYRTCSAPATTVALSLTHSNKEGF